MKILFLCGSLEPGKDGVGDYTRRLSGALLRKGHDAQIISLCDKHVDAVVSETQEIEATQVSVHRIPRKTSYHKRVRITKEIIDKNKPDWISLQYVPNSFNPKGLPFWLLWFLKQFNGKYKRHIMFHELARPGKSNLKKAIRTVQLALLKQLVFKLEPNVVHTHIPYYLSILKKLKINAKPLPLFSNICKVTYSIVERKDVFRVGLFSKIEATKNIAFLLKNLVRALANENKTLEIVLLGGSQTKLEKFIEKLKSYDIKAKTIALGFLSPNEVSMELQKLNLGISPVPVHVLGKSGSVAAFIANGVPLVVTESKTTLGLNKLGFLSQYEKEYVITKYDQPDILLKPKKHQEIDNLTTAVDTIITDLKLKKN